MASHLLSAEGLFVGGSSAMNCVGAVRVARKLGPGHTIVTVLCDGGQRYMGSVHSPEVQQRLLHGGEQAAASSPAAAPSAAADSSEPSMEPEIEAASSTSR